MSRAVVHRVLVLAAVLGTSAALAVLSAHEERPSAGTSIVVTGFAVLGVVLWAVAWLRDAWGPRGDHVVLLTGLTGLLFLAVGGPAVVTEVVLAHRGAPAEMVVARVQPFRNGGGDYTLVRPGGSVPLRGELRDDAGFAAGERFTVLADRGGFVRPMLPEDVDPAWPACYVLAGTGLLGVVVLRRGFPLGGRRRPALTRGSGRRNGSATA